MGKTVDITSRQTIGLVTVPALPAQYIFGQTTINANSTKSFIVTTTPQSTLLQLWNFLFSIAIDAPSSAQILNTDANGNLLYVLPSGTALTSGMLAVTVDDWTDWARSNDNTNTRVNIVRIHNQDSSQHTYYLMFKAYTFSYGAASVAGSGGGT